MGSTKPQTTLLIDSDIVAFKFASVCQKNFDWDGDGVIATHIEPPEEAYRLTEEYIEDLVEKLEANHVVVCLTSPNNWRYDVLPSYKANRKDVVKPELLEPIKEFLRSKYETFERPRMEADDIMGILSTNPKLFPGKKIIVSEDKDMKTIPGWLFNPAKDDMPRNIHELEADYWHLYQTIVGDATDGYVGCPGAGPKLAEEFLKGELKYEPYEYTFSRGPRKGKSETRYNKVVSGSPWDTVVSIYNKAGLTEADALVQARVARICRSSDYDFKNKQVILWNP